jgi:hypothetical protein
MRTKRETRENDEIQREFNLPRYIWVFAQNWILGKRENKLEKFWGEVRGSLEEFDKKNPTGRRSVSISETSTIGTGQPSATKQIPSLRDSPVTTNNPISSQAPDISSSAPGPNPSHAPIPMPKPKNVKPTPKPTPKPMPKPTTLPKPTATPTTLPKPTPIPTTKPKATPMPRSVPKLSPNPTPVPKNTTIRTRTPPPVAGPSRPQAYTTSPGPYSSSSGSSYVPQYISHRISWRAERNASLNVTPIEQNTTELSESNSEYQPKIKVQHEEKKDKGKGKMNPKDDDFGAKKMRKPPQPTEVVREHPCQRCVKKKIVCYNQAGGKSCLGCAKMKLRCVVFEEKEAEPSRSATLAKQQRQSKIAEKKKVAEKKMVSIDVESTSASSSESPAPVRKRQPRSKKVDGMRAERWEENEGKSDRKFNLYYLLIRIRS